MKIFHDKRAHIRSSSANVANRMWMIVIDIGEFDAFFVVNFSADRKAARISRDGQ